MKKKLILYLIAILTLIFGITTNVSAETIDTDFVGNHTNNANRTWEITANGGTSYDKEWSFTSNMNVSGYSYIKGMYYLGSTKTSFTTSETISLNNINFDLTCNQHVNYTTYPTANQPTIHYHDGTTSYISNWPIHDYICEEWKQNNLNINGTITSITPNIDNNPSVVIRFIDINNNDLPCTIDKSSFTCLVGQYTTIKSIKATIRANGSQNTYNFFLSNLIWKIKDSTQDIINNQNQNQAQNHSDSQAINNNITNTYNFISDSTIDNNTNTDNISSQYNSTSSNNVLNLLLIPINFIQTIINGFNDSCTQVCIGQCPSGGGVHDNAWYFIFPCIDLQSLLGSTLYNVIDALMCFAMIFAFIRSVVGFFKKALLLELDAGTEVSILS